MNFTQSKKINNLLFMLFLILGAALSVGAYYMGVNVIKLGKHSQKTTLYILTLTPFIISFLVGGYYWLKKSMTSYLLSERFITIKTLENGLVKTSTCDMNDVLDIEKTNFGLYSSLKLMTRDKSDPIILIPNIDTKLAEEAFDYIRRYSINNMSELAMAKKRNTAHVE